ncbi:hypothetical protein BBJ28_00014262 [Nothophytophthora sp. Chile5]|nr:hypothetical protein BBJ28_00014262 [Nothophytophthora sp. Chile5]
MQRQPPHAACSAPPPFGADAANELDMELLAALDEMLDFSQEPPPLIDPQQLMVEGCELVNAFADPEELFLPTSAPSSANVDASEDADANALLFQVLSSSAQLTKTEPALKEEPKQQQQRSGKDARAAPYSKPKPRRRKRPKDELDYLRVKVADLEEELAALGQSGANATETGTLSPPNGDGGELFVRWKQVADRQQEEANRAVVENLKLRAMLEGQLQVARSLEAAIDHHQREAAQTLPWQRVQASSNDEPGGRRRPRATSVSDDLIFTQLNGNLEAQYAEVDAVLEASGLANVNHEVRSGIQAHRDVNGVSFVHEEARVLPFPVLAVNRAMWGCLRYHDTLNAKMGHVQMRVVNNDHLNATILDTLQLPKSNRINMATRIAIRRYFEADRVVVVWSSYVEIAGSVFVRLREKGYNSASTFDFQRGARGPMECAMPGCILRGTVRVTPETVVFDSEEEAQTHIGEMTNLVVGTYHRNFGLLYQVVENLLLKDAMGG